MKNMKRKNKKIVTSLALSIAVLAGTALPVSADDNIALRAGCGQWYVASVTKATCTTKRDCGPGGGLRVYQQTEKQERKCVKDNNKVETEKRNKIKRLGCCKDS